MWNNYAMIPTNAPQQVPVAPGVTDASYHDNLGEFDAPSGTVNPLFRFATFLMRLRHRHPALCRAAWGDMEAGGEDVSYLFRAPDGDGSPREGDRALAVHIDALDDGIEVPAHEEAGSRVGQGCGKDHRAVRRQVEFGLAAQFVPLGVNQGETHAIADPGAGRR